MIVYHGLTEIIKIRTFRIRRIYEFWQEIFILQCLEIRRKSEINLEILNEKTNFREKVLE